MAQKSRSLGPEARGARLVEALLDPSRTVRPGYETVTLALEDGSVLAGLKASESATAITLRDPARGGQTVTIDTARIAERKDGGASIMPDGLVNALGSRQEFLDLVRLLDELAAHPEVAGDGQEPARDALGARQRVPEVIGAGVVGAAGMNDPRGPALMHAARDRARHGACQES